MISDAECYLYFAYQVQTSYIIRNFTTQVPSSHTSILFTFEFVLEWLLLTGLNICAIFNCGCILFYFKVTIHFLPEHYVDFRLQICSN